MCTLCQALNPALTELDMHVPESLSNLGADFSADGSGSISAELPTYSLNQIADYLTTGYWEDTGRKARSFDIEAEGDLTVDLTGLGTAGREAARDGLEAWSSVSGINFIEIDPSSTTSQPTITATRTEDGDAAADTSTTASLGVNERFLGTIDKAAEVDWIKVNLTAGQTYTITMSGYGSNPVSDTYLQLFDSGKTQVAFNDDAAPGDSGSAIEFTASKSGTYYIAAKGYGIKTGDYEVRMTRGADLSKADITFTEEGSSASSSSYVIGNDIQSSTVNIGTNWAQYGAYYEQTYIHEIGHALGLGHAGNYNNSGSFGSSAHYANDSWQTTVMSYFDQTENPNVDASKVYLASAAMADIVAIQNLYGTPTNVRAGNTVYGDNASSDAYGMNLPTGLATTIFDSGGIDLINLAGRGADQELNLNATSYSNLFNKTGNFAIARGTVIENAYLGSGDDRVTGNGVANDLRGGGGNDTLIGGGGNDTLTGGTGADTLDGDEGVDVAVFTGKSTNYSVVYDKAAASGGALKIVDTAGITDVLTEIEALLFDDIIVVVSDLLQDLKSSFGTPGTGTSHKVGIADVGNVPAPEVLAPTAPEPVNTAPQANADSAVVTEGNAVNIAVLANDKDADGDQLSISSVNTAGLNGSVKVNANGTLTYDAGSAFNSLYEGESATESFTYKISDGEGGTDTATVNVKINGTGTPPAVTQPVSGDARMEIGGLSVEQANSDTWQSVRFMDTIIDAAVVMGPLTFNGGQPATVRVRNVSETGFEFQIDEWDYLDGAHISETVSWMAGTKGTHILDDGSTVSFGSVTASDGGATRVDLSGFTKEPVVLGQLAGDAEGFAMTHRIDNHDRTGFEVSLEAEEAREAKGVNLAAETFYYVGIDAALESKIFQSGVTGTTHDFASTGANATGRAVLADMQTTNGGDTAALRYETSANGTLKIKVEEEQSGDDEIRHIEEKVGWVLAEEGSYALGTGGIQARTSTSADAHLEVASLSVHQTSATQWHSVSFSEAIADAVVVMGPASIEGADPFSVRVRNIDETGFQFQIDEWDYLDGSHAMLDISWMAGSAGDHTMADGSKISLGRADAADVSGGNVSLNGFDDKPMIFAQLTGDAEEAALAHRIDNVGADGFDFSIDVEEAQVGRTTDIADEALNWVAFDLAAGSTQANGGVLSVTHNLTSTGEKIGATEAIFADMNSSYGPDTATTRFDLNGSNVLEVMLQEEASLDDELAHTSENVAWLTLEEGLYDFV